MIGIKVHAEFKDAFRQLDALSQQLRERVIARALNRAGEAAKTQAKKSISSTYNITSTKVGERIRVSKTFAGGNLTVVVRVVSKFHSKRATNLITFGAEQNVNRRAIARMYKKGTAKWGDVRRAMYAGVKVKIRRDRRPVKNPKWFLLTNSKTGGRFVAVRTGKGRGDIESVVTGDVGQMFNSRPVNAAILARARQAFLKEFSHQLTLVQRTK